MTLYSDPGAEVTILIVILIYIVERIQYISIACSLYVSFTDALIGFITIIFLLHVGK